MFLREQPKQNITIIKPSESTTTSHSINKENPNNSPNASNPSEREISVKGINISRMLHSELIREKSLQSIANNDIRAFCSMRWTELAEAIAALPESIEFLLAISSDPRVSVNFWVIGSGETTSEAQKSCQKSYQHLWTLLSSKLDYVELQPTANIPDGQLQLEALEKCVSTPHISEARRYYAPLAITHSDRPATDYSKPFGFCTDQLPDSTLNSETEETDEAHLYLNHLSPWIPTLDPWQIMLEMIEKHSGSAFIAHFQNLAKAPDKVLQELQSKIVTLEQTLAGATSQPKNLVLSDQTTVLREMYVQAQDQLRKNIIAARVFIVSEQPDATLLSIIKTSISSINSDKPFRGGVEIRPTEGLEILAPLNQPSIDILFSPAEATAVLRTPIPTNAEMPGLPYVRSRVAPMLGVSGDDCLLGINSSKPVCLDQELRFRHTYIIGQSGTGKSTMMKQMILHDIAQGRGVGVLDPHGELIQQILESFPKDRAEDLVLVDLTDVERPVGFNILKIHESDPFKYRLARDFTIDEIYSYLDRTYDMKKTGGPMFESYYRSFMGLLMSSEMKKAPRIPNLMIFRALFGNEDLRSLLLADENDHLIVDAVEEALRTGGEASLDNMAPYITCKFSRFINNTALRNITCQNQMLDIDKILKEGKVLLFYSGKGKFGEMASGLLTSQMVSRICNAAMKRGTQGKPFYLYVDEFQVLADERFAEILAEARKFKLSLTVAHQYVDQLPAKVLTAILGNVGTIISLRVGAIDSGSFEPLFFPVFSQKDLINLPNYSAYVKSSGTLGQIPFSIEIPNPALIGKDTEFATKLRNLSRKKYGRDRLEVEAEINRTYNAYKNISFF